jgi:hypothetical protein
MQYNINETPKKCAICGTPALPFHILCDLCRMESCGYEFATFKLEGKKDVPQN